MSKVPLAPRAAERGKGGKPDKARPPTSAASYALGPAPLAVAPPALGGTPLGGTLKEC